MTARPAPSAAGVRSRDGDEMGDQDGPGADLEAEAGEQAGRDAGVRPPMGLQHGAPSDVRHGRTSTYWDIVVGCSEQWIS